jgi:geranylgeranyl diphosphate synthase type II
VSTVKERLSGYAREVEAYLQGSLAGLDIPLELRRAMDYSLMAGGKRLRPVLCLCFARMHGLEGLSAMPLACAFEFIHTYSLIHDDLPAMDDDDLRRGRPSNHKVFGEAMAILAGDGLLTEAFGLLARECASIPAERVLKALGTLAEASGAAGMVGGQALDMAYTAKTGITIEEIGLMQAKKTGALITAACQCGAELAGAGPDHLIRARDFGRAVGAAFQIVDDVLDVIGDEKEIGKPVGSDQAQGKVTYPSLMGVDKSMGLAREHVAQALACLASYTGPEAEFLAELAQYIVDRVS